MQTELHNYAGHAITSKVRQQVVEWKSRAVHSKLIEVNVQAPAHASR